MDNKNLENKKWYRLLKVIAVSVIVVSFFIPMFNGKGGEIWIIDGLINVILWSIIIFVLKKILFYILFGSQSQKQELSADEHALKRKRERNIDKKVARLAICVIIFIPIIIVVFFYIFHALVF